MGATFSPSSSAVIPEQRCGRLTSAPLTIYQPPHSQTAEAGRATAANGRHGTDREGAGRGRSEDGGVPALQPPPCHHFATRFHPVYTDAWSQRLASRLQWGSSWVDFRSPVRKPCWATAEPKTTHFCCHLSSLKPVDRAAGPVRALARGARQVHPLHHTSPTLPAWQPLAPQRAGPSAGITPVPRSGRAPGARPPGPP